MRTRGSRIAQLVLVVGVLVVLAGWKQAPVAAARPASTPTCQEAPNHCIGDQALSAGGYLEGQDYWGFGSKPGGGCGDCWWVQGLTFTQYANYNDRIYVYTAGWDRCSQLIPHGWEWYMDTTYGWNSYNNATYIETSQYWGVYDYGCDYGHDYGLSGDHERWNSGVKEGYAFTPVVV